MSKQYERYYQCVNSGRVTQTQPCYCGGEARFNLGKKKDRIINCFPKKFRAGKSIINITKHLVQGWK